MHEYCGEKFLNNLYKDLVNSDSLKHTSIGRDKNEDLNLFFNRFDLILKKILERNKINLVKKYFYDKYVIKFKNMPNSYFDNLKLIALNRGYGHVEYTRDLKYKKYFEVVCEQKASLDNWIDFLFEEKYPMWFRYYTVRSVLKIGNVCENFNKFSRRNDGTVIPFIGFNRKCMDAVYNYLMSYLKNGNIDDNDLRQLFENGNFSKIYLYVLKNLSIDKSNTDGIWKKYEKGSNALALFSDIYGKGTGWCTAFGLDTAQFQLDLGDFYVYYTLDNELKYTIPRIAIRMEFDSIAEVCGVVFHQSLEDCMKGVAFSKLKEFSDADVYLKKVNDMEMLTNIYNKFKNNCELTSDELIFLYEVDDKISGFGYDKDPRINEILSKRNSKKDYCLIYKNKNIDKK